MKAVLAVQQTVTRYRDRESDRVNAADDRSPGRGQAILDRPEHTGKIHEHSDANIDDIMHVVDEDAEMHDKAAEAVRYQKEKYDTGNKHQHHHIGLDSVDHHHDDDDQEGKQRFESETEHLYEQQHLFRYIDPADHHAVAPYHDRAVLHRHGEETPHSDARHDKYGEVRLLEFEDNAEHDRIDQHQTERLEYPPNPVEVGIGYLRAQFSFGGVKDISTVLFPVPVEARYRLRKGQLFSAGLFH